MHGHHDSHCQHDLRYCSICDAAYCKKCSREWVKQNFFTTGGNIYGGSSSIGYGTLVAGSTTLTTSTDNHTH